MSHSRGWHLIQGLTVTAVLLVAALPVESAVQLIQPSPEAEKALSCTVPSPSQERVTGDRPISPPRVAAGERALEAEQAPEGERAPRTDPAHPEVCPLRLEQAPGPPQGRP
jgi:hypothetical protein